MPFPSLKGIKMSNLKSKIEECFRCLFLAESDEKQWKDDPNLKDTPDRIARMWREFFPSTRSFPALNCFPNDFDYDEIIMLDNIPFTSVCSHHFQNFSGKAWFLYLPDKTVIGASKVKRLIDYYCKEPQLQERLSMQIMNKFVEEVEPQGAMLVMRAVHMCMACRGVETGFGAGMTTSVSNGVFRQLEVRTEALNLIRISQEMKI
jgi:GTP cyclohydrolase I